MAAFVRTGRGIPETTALYQIFIRNYTKEGTFAAAIKKLSEVKNLGFSWVYLTPIHPIGKVNRKGSQGSPYAIADYRKVDPELGTVDDLKNFITEANRLGLKVMIDVVYNHTAPDSRLAHEHPEWFLKGADGKPGRKCEDWSDVIDLDYLSPESRESLWDELIDTLIYWRELGIEGFRCDVASLVPREFWVEARRRVNLRDPATGAEKRPTLWLAESVHPSFLLYLRDAGFHAWSEPELHDAFDLTYDYDGWQRLEQVWSGKRPLAYYLDFLEVQRAAYPAWAQKIRYLENHDQRRAASRFGKGKRLEAWTAFYQLLPGCTFAYMGQEWAIEEYPTLFEKNPVPWEQGDKAFREYFGKLFNITQKIKSEAPRFSWTELAEGLVLLERQGNNGKFSCLCNLDGRSGFIELSKPLEGTDLLSGKAVHLKGRIDIPQGALLIKG
ncbi:alpha-amylase family glycosyl hydrolase [Gracilinema caldarium]|uniref:alpha-amylase family glycosyl hydrolase n=1 Tax=Gracilinema caldarium TaxID=215591 RepID=UPI0026ECF195|nr:alpha-amylase family glycosyl hydrolase [Gracilinema caldarium]